MRYERKQKIVERKTYDIIDELANEFSLDFDAYPEVYWLGNKREFDSLKLDMDYYEGFKSLRKTRSGKYLPEPKIILLATSKRGIIGEEAGHFLHSEISKINLKNERVINPIDYYSKHIIFEMVGYFCAKLICSKREDATKEYKNLKNLISKNIRIPEDKLEDILENFQKIGNTFYIHNIGYSLGNELFNNYLAGNVNKKQIRNLMKNSFKEPFSATEKFLYLRKRFMKNNIKRDSELN